MDTDIIKIILKLGITAHSAKIPADLLLKILISQL